MIKEQNGVKLQLKSIIAMSDKKRTGGTLQFDLDQTEDQIICDEGEPNGWESNSMV